MRVACCIQGGAILPDVPACACPGMGRPGMGCPGASHDACGQVFTWGNGASYQLGTGGTGLAAGPMRVDGLRLGGVTAVSVAKFHSAAVTAEGRLLTWGWGRGGRLGALMRPLKSTSAACRCLPSAGSCSGDSGGHVAASGSSLRSSPQRASLQRLQLLSSRVAKSGSFKMMCYLTLRNTGLQSRPGRRR